MSAYYNEFDPYAAQWLRNLIAAGHIAPGYVDERSISEVQPDDLQGYTQYHFFAGIGGWSLAARLAGWPDERPVWTGSCPCQPFSAAGKRKGTADERHLWPEFRRLIAECRPDVVFGEQVEGAVRFGWLDGIRADLEAEGYALGVSVLGAHSVGAPHIRQRLWWVADYTGEGRRPERPHIDAADGNQAISAGQAESGRCRATSGMADTDGRLAGDGNLQSGRQHGQQPQDGVAGERLAYPVPAGRAERWASSGDGQAAGSGRIGRLGDAGSQGLAIGSLADDGRGTLRQQGPTASAPSVYGWANSEWLACSDGKARRVEPGIFPLAHGVSNRVGRLRAYGNAIVPQVAAEFIGAWLEARP